MGKPGHTYPLHGASAAVSCMHALIWHRRVAQSTVRPARAVLSLAGHSKTTVGRLLRACPCRKAPIGIEHALCLTVPLTRILTLRARFVLVCLRLCVYIPSNLHLSANSRGLCIAQRISFTSCAELSSEGLTILPSLRRAYNGIHANAMPTESDPKEIKFLQPFAGLQPPPSLQPSLTLEGKHLRGRIQEHQQLQCTRQCWKHHALTHHFVRAEHHP